MILITGASSGIGEACAWSLAESGRSSLFLVGRRGEKLKSLAQEIEKKHQTKVLWAALDVRSQKDVQSFAEQYHRELESLSAVVNNAGLAAGANVFQEGVLEDWETMIDTNLKGLLYMTKAVLPNFIKNKSGHIINIGSVAGHWVYPKGNVYCATKAAVTALSEGLRYDLMGTGIRVTEICPGMVETEFSLVRFKGDQEKAKAVYQGVQPLTGQDVAEAVTWAISRPQHVNVQQMVLYSTDQASPTMVHRRI